MTKDEYRQHMRKYSKDTLIMSYVVTKHPDYIALREAGKEIIPYLLEDMLDPNWYCGACNGFGYEFVSTWEEEWYDHMTFPPRSTGNICPKCSGKGHVNSWACMMLISGIAGDDCPKIANWMRGRHDPLLRAYRKWGAERGYLPPIPEEPNALTKVGRTIMGILRLWSHD